MGCVLGAFVGDAAGATLEFLDHNNINKMSVKKAMMLEGGGLM
jgi:ADP-ribosylglycohydrolase